MRYIFLILLASASSLLSAQNRKADDAYIVNTTDDTIVCSDIKLKQRAVTCQTKKEKIELRNEFVRRIYLPVKESPWEMYFKTYAEKGRNTVYQYSPKMVQDVLKTGMYPRFFDMKPIDENHDFWARGLFEILVEHNGYKLCKLKAVKSSTPSFASTGNDNLDKYILFEQYEATGVTIDKHNFKQQLSKVSKGCAKAMEALNNDPAVYLKDMQLFLILLAECPN